MDLKEPGNLLYMVGVTADELGGSHFALVAATFRRPACRRSIRTLPSKPSPRMHHAIHAGLVRACHDLSEGGLAVAAAEMAFAGGFGASLDLDAMPCHSQSDVLERLFSESNTRFLCEVQPNNAVAFESALAGIARSRIGQVVDGDRFEVCKRGEVVIDCDLATLKEAWQKPLRW